MKQTNIKSKKSKGLTLMELMIAMVIGLMLLGGALSMFINNKRIYKQVNEVGRLQENARFALEMLTRDIRMAGFYGCHHNVTAVTNDLVGAGTSGYLLDETYGIEGIEGGATAWSPSGNSDGGAFGISYDITPANIGTRFTDATVPDAITVRYLSGEFWDVVDDNDPAGDGFEAGADAAFMATEDTSINWAIISTADNHPDAGDRANDFAPGELISITDCANSDIFQLINNCTSTNSPATCPAANGRIVRLDGTGTFPGAPGPGNTVTTHSFSRTYTEGSKVRRYNAVRYYVGNGGYGGPSLFRQFPVLDADGSTPTDDYAVSIENQELIEGVENMQIMYGVDTDQDGIPENYYVAGVAALNDDTAWGNVVSVKLALLLRTVETSFGSDTKTYSLLGVDNVNPIDMGVRRRVFTTTIQLRNRISR